MIKIQNRKNMSLAVWVENDRGKNGLVFIAHGLSGRHDQANIRTYAEAFLENDFVVVSYDATCSLGQSDGNLENATLTGYYEDFEDVIEWAGSQLWYEEPFVVAGHSLGGACNLLFAYKNPAKIRALAPTSAFLSGKLSLREAYSAQEIEKWEKDGYILEKSKSRPGIIKKLNWTLAVDWKKYNLLTNAHLIKAPILLIVGENDTPTPPSSQMKLLENVSSSQKELHVIKGSEHTFMAPEHLEEVKTIFLEWIKKLLA